MLPGLIHYANLYLTNFRLYFGIEPVVVIAKPKEMKIVLNRVVEKSKQYEFLRKWIGNGVLTSKGIYNSVFDFVTN